MISIILFTILISIIFLFNKRVKENFNEAKLYRPYIVPVIQVPLDLTLSPKEEENGNKGVWSDWSECNAECGVGKRKRFCLEGNCYGPEEEVCQKKSCPKWSEWSECSKICGDGTQIRTCLEGECDGDSNKPCNLGKCPNNEFYKELTVIWVKDRFNTLFFADKLGLNVNDIYILEGEGYQIKEDKINFPNETYVHFINLMINKKEMKIRLNVRKFEHDSEFNPYLRSFFQELSTFNKATDNQENDILIAFDPGNTLLKWVNGESYSNNNKVYIVINRRKWDNLKTYLSKELLIYHELGHGVLGRDWPDFHTDKLIQDNLKRNIPASIMGHPKVPSYVYEKNREGYLHELFHSKNNDDLELGVLQKFISAYIDETIKFSISDVIVEDNIYLEINKNNVTNKTVKLIVKGSIQGENTVIIDKIVDVPSDMKKINGSTKIKLLKNIEEIIPKDHNLLIDLSLEIEEKQLDKKTIQLVV